MVACVSATAAFWLSTAASEAPPACFSRRDNSPTFPFDKLKIDQSFVQTLGADQRGGDIISAIANLGQNFGMTTVAEGVETGAQYEIVSRQGRTEVRGKYYGMPLTASEVPSFIGTLRGALAPVADGPEARAADGADPSAI